MNTNTPQSSVGRAQHSEPTFTLYGRVAAGRLGEFGRPYHSLHISLVIDDAYSGITVIDGQPTELEAGPKNVLRIRTNIYADALPTNPVLKIPLNPPAGMSRNDFALRLKKRALDFSSYVVPYSFPRQFVGDTMKPGEYNSSSYLAALLRSVMGYVPDVRHPGYQTPGWENPMPSSYFKGEAIR